MLNNNWIIEKKNYNFFFAKTTMILILFQLAVSLFNLVHEKNDSWISFISHKTGDNRSKLSREQIIFYTLHRISPSVIRPARCRALSPAEKDRRSSCYCCRLIKGIDERLSSSSRLASSFSRLTSPSYFRVPSFLHSSCTRAKLRMYCAPELRHSV